MRIRILHYLIVIIFILFVSTIHLSDSSTRRVFVSLQVDLVPPVSIDEPQNLTYLVHTIGHQIEWQPSYDGFWVFASYFYSVFRNGTEIQHGHWGSDDESPIIVNIDGLYPSTYNYTIVISNYNVATNTVYVTVTGPVGWPIVFLVPILFVAIILVIYSIKMKKQMRR